ncbi:MAG: SGNH/GDSL hydrolase family protein [Gemmatimonadales bacterium]
MTRTTQILAAAALVLTSGVAACDHDQLNRPFGNVAIDPLFARYVAMGNSITAGFQSGGIDSITQLQAYPVLLARAMRSPFFAPILGMPGCPPLYTNVFTQERASATPCALRSIPRIPPPYISNTAVPGAEVIDIYDNLDAAANANELTTFILGGLTQVQMMLRGDPTFVSIWIGNNDVLGAATDFANGGDTTLITPVATFQARYAEMLDSVDRAAPRGGALIGVANVTAIPFFSLGATYFGLKNMVPSPLPAAFTVSSNCAPTGSLPGARGDSVLVPFPYGGALLEAAEDGTPTNLDCADTVAAVVVPAELRQLVTAVNGYNTFIQGAAAARGWVYVDPNPTLDSLRAIPTEIAPFPAFGAPCSANPFGLTFSCDAVHPSAATQRLFARKLALAINAVYGTNIPPIP